MEQLSKTNKKIISDGKKSIIKEAREKSRRVAAIKKKNKLLMQDVEQGQQVIE